MSESEMGNQQGNFGDTDLSWLAGFMDGEGSFGFQQIASPEGRRAHKRPYFNPRITVGNTDMATLEYLQAIYTQYRIPHHVTMRRNRGLRLNGVAKSDFWQVRTEGIRRCVVWLEVVTPFLHTKHDQAQVMLEFCRSRLDAEGWKKPYSEREETILGIFRDRRSEALTDYTPAAAS